jgi:ABC-type amino acid transport substrate-binding protein
VSIRGEVTIAVDRSNPPYSFEDGGEVRGSTITLVTQAFAGEAIQPRFAAVDGPMAQTVAVAAGRAEMAADVSVTARRAQWYRFSDHYGSEELQVFTMRDGPLWPGMRHFHGLLGLKSDSYAQEYLIRHHRTVPLVLAGTTEQVIEMLRRGRVQAIVLARTAGEAFIEQSGEMSVLARGAPFGATLLALSALPDHQELLTRFNRGLKTLGQGRTSEGGNRTA